MKRTFAILIGLTVLTMNAFAARQNETVLCGSAIEESGAPAGFATAFLTNAEGVLVVGTTAGEEGRFELKAPQGTYTLTVSLVGFKDASLPVTLNQAQQELPPVRLEEDKQLLGEAVVQAVMPKTKLTGEGLATSVHGSVLENAGTARDVLGKVPGIIKGRDGIEVIGKGAPIWIARVNNTFTLNKGWQLELGGEYHSPGQQQNITLTNHYFDLTAAAQKTLLKDGSLVLRLEGRDLAYLGHNNVFTNLGHYNITQSVLMDTQRLVFSIRYRFNTTESKYKGTGAGKDVRSRMGGSN